MERRQAFKFQLLPNGEQRRNMRKFFGCKRFTYNQALAINEEMYRLIGRKHTRYQLDKLIPEWKKETPWLPEAPCHCLQQALVDLERAYTRFFADGKKGLRIAPKDQQLRKTLRKRGVPLAYPPTFKKKGQHDSFRESDPKGIKLDQNGSRIQLPKLGWIRYRNSREVLGEVKNVTVSESCGKFFVSMQTAREVDIPKHRSSSEVGIDIGVVVFATMSDCRTSSMPDTSRLEQRKRFLQRRLKNKSKFSSNWKKLQQRIKKIDQRISNIRDNHHHQFTNTITKNHGIVYGDDLEIKNMTKSAKGTAENPGKKVRQKAGLNRSMQAQGIGEVNRQLQYKSAWRGGIFIPCPPAYGSQHCPSCGCTRKENRKTQALFRCVNPNCQFTANADWVAALNKLEAGRAFVACGEFPSWTRLGAFGTNSVKQEPTEGFPCASVSSL
jgi:putative transposase